MKGLTTEEKIPTRASFIDQKPRFFNTWVDFLSLATGKAEHKDVLKNGSFGHCNM